MAQKCTILILSPGNALLAQFNLKKKKKRKKHNCCAILEKQKAEQFDQTERQAEIQRFCATSW